ncbi:MAG: carbohydrate ABC transporter permease [Lachnospiraceae bacterium]|nr:carbohydrate ABC transporter permease [Lachnospiraceae bacterium]
MAKDEKKPKMTRAEKKAKKAEIKALKKQTKLPMSKERVRKILMGSKDRMGLLEQIALYVILTAISFVFVYPLLKMFATSMMSLSDLVDSSINWIPSSFYLDNYKTAFRVMDFWNTLWKSIVLAGVPTLIQVAICSFIGYGFAMFNFRGKTFLMGFMILSWVLPQCLTMSPTYQVYNSLGILGTIWAFVLPAIVGQGLKAPLFILICWQFFRQIPSSLHEAAKIDGAGYFKQYWKIGIPSASGAMLVVFLFSFVWYWNESYMTSTYIVNSTSSSKSLVDWTNMVVKLSSFDDSFTSYTSSSTGSSFSATVNTSYRMAGTILTILPLLLMYLVLQKQFVESVDNAGITGQ